MFSFKLFVDLKKASLTNIARVVFAGSCVKRPSLLTFLCILIFQLGMSMQLSCQSRPTGTQLSQVRFLGAAKDFFRRLNFQCRLSYGVHTPPCAIACINICAYVKDPVVHVRVRWIIETLKHPACTVGWLARLCRSSFSSGKETRISHERNSGETTQKCQ